MYGSESSPFSLVNLEPGTPGTLNLSSYVNFRDAGKNNCTASHIGGFHARDINPGYY
jgi:hypothetical protein